MIAHAAVARERVRSPHERFRANRGPAATDIQFPLAARGVLV